MFLKCLIMNLNFILSTSSILFNVGMPELVFNIKNILIIIIISIELMLLKYLFFILTAAASELYYGIRHLIISYYRIKGHITVDLFVETIKH